MGDCEVELNKISPAFIERNSQLRQNNKSPSGVSNASPVYLTCRKSRRFGSAMYEKLWKKPQLSC